MNMIESLDVDCYMIKVEFQGVFFLLVWNVLDVFYLMKCIRIVCVYNWNCVWCVLCFEVVQKEEKWW